MVETCHVNTKPSWRWDTKASQVDGSRAVVTNTWTASFLRLSEIDEVHLCDHKRCKAASSRRLPSLVHRAFLATVRTEYQKMMRKAPNEHIEVEVIEEILFKDLAMAIVRSAQWSCYSYATSDVSHR